LAPLVTSALAFEIRERVAYSGENNSEQADAHGRTACYLYITPRSTLADPLG